MQKMCRLVRCGVVLEVLGEEVFSIGMSLQEIIGGREGSPALIAFGSLSHLCETTNENSYIGMA